jgi:leucyl/phenylalanyl-tRNA---protein transferase
MTGLTPELLVEAYRQGMFPMADSAASRFVRWYAPDPRGVLPLESFHVPGNVAKAVRRGRFEVTTDRAFGEVIRSCGDRESTWISQQIIAAYSGLHELGCAHSVECWADGVLAGGLYGVALGGAFFGESMFYRVRDASKVALVHLAERLVAGGFVLLDIQMVTSLTEQFGAVEIPRPEYERRLAAALRVEARW